MHNFRILKVMTICINAYASFCDTFSSCVTGQSQADFVESRAHLIHYWHWLTHKLSHIPIAEMPDSIKFQWMCFGNRWYAAIFESHADSPKLKTGETVPRFELNSSVKQLSRGDSLT